MDIEALRSILRAVRSREAARRIVIFGSSSLLISLSGTSPAALGVETTLDADLLLDPDDETARRSLDEAFGSDSKYDAATGFHADFVNLTSGLLIEAGNVFGETTEAAAGPM